MIPQRAAAALAALLIGAVPAAAIARDCEFSPATAGLEPDFAAYRVPLYQGRSARPRLVTPRQRMYQGMIRFAAEHAPWFAGHYAIGVWGCGAGCRQLVIVDRKSGRVWFDPQLSYYSAEYAHQEPDSWEFSLSFRADSRLLTFAGIPLVDGGEPDRKHIGVSLFEWRGDRLHRLRFVPIAKLCPKAADADADVIITATRKPVATSPSTPPPRRPATAIANHARWTPLVPLPLAVILLLALAAMIGLALYRLRQIRREGLSPPPPPVV